LTIVNALIIKFMDSQIILWLESAL